MRRSRAWMWARELERPFDAMVFTIAPLGAPFVPFDVAGLGGATLERGYLLDGGGGAEVTRVDDELWYSTRTPSRIGATKAGVDRTVESLSSQQFVSAMLAVGDFVYVVVVTVGPSVYGAFEDVRVRRAPRRGGPFVDVVVLEKGTEAPDGIFADSHRLFLPLGDDLSRAPRMLVFDLETSELTRREYRNVGARTTRVAFDGESFFWGERDGSGRCTGALRRMGKDATIGDTPVTGLARVRFVAHVDPELFVSHLDETDGTREVVSWRGVP